MEYISGRFSEKLIDQFKLVKSVLIEPIDSLDIKSSIRSTYYVLIQSFSLLDSKPSQTEQHLFSTIQFQFLQGQTNETIYFNSFRLKTSYYRRISLLDFERHIDKLAFYLFDQTPFVSWKE